ncbi:hypothetical protein [Megalodesulfovibrio gigas]|uniref:hypothetical protein n=1 Tax=Megalodesulfovibrio gigas TaxID=879 RepID=UPI0004212B42|nr:hypothetical protein [Megalodesulfovibrio gigas]
MVTNVKSPDTQREIAGHPNVKSPDNQREIAGHFRPQTHGWRGFRGCCNLY